MAKLFTMGPGNVDSLLATSRSRVAKKRRKKRKKGFLNNAT